MNTEHTTLLRIDASCRGERSLTRMLSSKFFAEWTRRKPNTMVIERDVGRTPPPFVSEEWIAAAFAKEPDRTDQMNALLAYSDRCIRELLEASVYVIAVPMYNYGMPAALKAWIDQIVRVNETFTFDLARGDYPLAPILRDKRLVILSSRGEFGFAPGDVRADMNHLDPHLKTLERYLGVVRSWNVTIEYQEFGDDRHSRSKTGALESIPRVVSEVIRDLEYLQIEEPTSDDETKLTQVVAL